MTTTAISYCRLCPTACGIVLELDAGRVVKISGDKEQPLTRGFTCTKGRHFADFHTDPSRLRQSLRRADDGNLEPVTADTAIAEIAARLTDIIAEHGPESVALYTGTSAAMASLTLPFTIAFWRTIGSSKKFSSMSVDQSAKWVAENRLGRWAAGGQRFAEADVWMLVGTNPLVSMQGGYFTGFPIHDGIRRLQHEQQRGLQLIVVDPRRTELAARADLHLQIIPGTDAVLFASIIGVLFNDDVIDHEFTAEWADGLDALHEAVAPFTPQRAGAVCGVDADDIIRAANIFAAGPRGMVTGGTGPDMGPHANLAEHLIQVTNVLCGRYVQAGEPLAGTAVLASGKPLPAEALAPDRHWEHTEPGVRGLGTLNGEMPSVTLPDEITRDDGHKIRALIVSGGNPAAAVPGTAALAEALASLDLLVTVDPYRSQTAELADYVIAPKMHLERPDTTRAYESLMDQPFAQYTPAILDAPADTIDDWEFFLRLAWAMGATLKVAGVEYPPAEDAPTADAILASFSARAQVPLDVVRSYPHGALFDEIEPVRAAPPGAGAAGRFAVAPTDVVAELAALDATAVSASPHDDVLLIVRRTKEVINSTGTQIAGLVRARPNPCHLHPEDLARLALQDGARVSVASAHGTIHTTVVADASLRPGVASMTHGFGGPGPVDAPDRSGASTNILLSAVTDVQAISGMPLMTAVPVKILQIVSS
jgi:anaerobic selenocysteine-containing dehydrogenase